MHIHTKTDSDATSIAPSSPTRSPRRPVYYVQSPSRDSHDGEKTTTATSFHSTPVISPMGSPGRHSRDSSSSRFSGSVKPPGGGKKISPNDAALDKAAAAGGGKKHRGGRDKYRQPWNKECEVIEEEGLLDDDEYGRGGGLPRRCYYLAFVLGFFVLFSFFSLVLWGASRGQRPQITMKSISINNLNVQAGTDATGVPTDMVTVNSTVKFTFRNTGSFFGVHVSSTPLDLAYTELTLASGSLKTFYQRRKSQRNVDIVLVGDRVPLYGSGTLLSANSQQQGSSGGGKAASATTVPGKQLVPLSLGFTVRARAYVLGKLVKPKFYINVRCQLKINPAKYNTPIPLRNACHFD